VLIWQRLTKKYVKQGGVHCTFHDLRAKAGSDKPDLESASALLGHASTETTKRVYRRRVTRATPVE
jgi:integrase